MNTSWEKLDSALVALMENNDELSDGELEAKYKRLRHLEIFIGKLATRVSERLRENTKPGPIQGLFDRYAAERLAVDEN